MRGTSFKLVEVKGYGKSDLLEEETMEELHERMATGPSSNGHASRFKVVEAEGYGRTDILEAGSVDELQRLLEAKLGRTA